VSAKLWQQTARSALARFAEEDGPELESAADGFFQSADALDGGVPVLCKLALGEGLAQVLNLLVLSASDGAQAIVSMLRHEQPSYIFNVQGQGLEFALLPY
jgi:hypothetical protein